MNAVDGLTQEHEKMDMAKKKDKCLQLAISSPILHAESFSPPLRYLGAQAPK